MVWISKNSNLGNSQVKMDRLMKRINRQAMLVLILVIWVWLKSLKEEPMV